LHTLVFAVGCTANQPPITFDPCGPLAIAPTNGTADQLASLDAAIAMWADRGIASISRADAAPLALTFGEASETLYGYYDAPRAHIYVNVDLTDFRQRSVTIAHELGHAVGLVHVAPDQRISVMNPANLSVIPDAGDQQALEALWGQCP
jgi:hypothetical protein